MLHWSHKHKRRKLAGCLYYTFITDHCLLYLPVVVLSADLQTEVKIFQVSIFKDLPSSFNFGLFHAFLQFFSNNLGVDKEYIW